MHFQARSRTFSFNPLLCEPSVIRITNLNKIGIRMRDTLITTLVTGSIQESANLGIWLCGRLGVD